MITEYSEDDILRSLCYDSFYHFYREFFSEMEKTSPLVDEPHIKFVADWMQEIIERLERDEEQKPNLDNQPPSTGKSTLAVALVAFYFTRNPGGKVLYCCHNTDLAEKNSQLVKDILESNKYQRLFPTAFVFRKDARGVRYFKATNGSLLRIASTQKSPIGNHFNLIVIDDPVDPEDALSKVKSLKANNFVNQSVPSRGLGNYALLMIMQRLSDADPAGTWLEMYGEEGINWLCLPAEKSHRIRPAAAEAIYDQVTGLLAPIRLSRKKLQKQQKALQNQYSGQYEQHPVPLAGGILKKAWFDLMEYTDFLNYTKKHKVVWKFDADTAYTKKQQNDPSALMCSAWVEELNTLFVREVAEEWLEGPALIETIHGFVGRNLEGSQYPHESLLYIEPKASGPTILQMLQASKAINATAAKAPTTEKVSRVNGITAFCASKKVVIISDKYQKYKWNEKFLAQLTTVPFARHDDMTDCLVQAVERILDTSQQKRKSNVY